MVMGSTPEAMVEHGYLPVGWELPVSLHPRAKDEYAPARTERKTARGYRSFAFNMAVDVTLKQDLSKRDHTVNLVAADAMSKGLNGKLIGELIHKARVDAVKAAL